MTPLRRKDRVKLKKKLDVIFSKRIRERDARKPCIDLCGRRGILQAGHFRRRELMSTRWHPKNVNGQNQYCNAFDNDTYRHAKGIDKRWGEGTAEELHKLSQKDKQWSVEEIERLIAAGEDYEQVYWDITSENHG